MHVDAQTMELGGLRQDGSQRDELIVRVFSGEAGAFTLYEDDGVSLAYQDGEVRTTLLSQQPLPNGLQVTIGAAQGSYAGAPGERANQLELVVENAAALQSVRLNGVELPRLATQAEWDAAAQGWYLAGERYIRVKTIPLAVELEKIFQLAW
jgi:alpha-glucosidase